MFDGDGEHLKKLGHSWAWLPQELLILIVELLKKLEDFVAFAFVCKSLGWFLAVGKDRISCLLNPFSNTEISLPSQSTTPNYWRCHPFEFVRKTVLSASPGEDPNFTVAVILNGHFRRIAFWRSGDTNWTLPETDYDYLINYDVTYYDGRFYSFNNMAQIRMYTFVEGNPLECKMFAHLKGYSEGYPCCKIDRLLGRRNIYIIRTENRILLGVRSFTLCRGWYCKKTSKFQVLEFCMRRKTWGQIDDLGNMAIFVGSLNATTMVDVSRFHGVIKANHIYFTNYGSGDSVYDGYDEVYKGDDIGVYDLKTGMIEPVYHGKVKHNRLSPATWIMPSF